MNEQQLKTIKLRVSVKLQIALEGLLNVIAHEDMFSDVSSEDIVQRIYEDMASPDMRLDMVSYLDSGRASKEVIPAPPEPKPSQYPPSGIEVQP